MISASAEAQLFRAYLASDGNDTNPCTLPQPCRLPAALAAVENGGEIWMLDSANYNTGPVNVAKSVTILAIPGAVGSVVATGRQRDQHRHGRSQGGAAQPGDRSLPRRRRLSGVNMSTAPALTVEGCLFANLPQVAILVNTAASVRITDTTIRQQRRKRA